jgi:integrase/recombinase XerC
LLGSKESTRLTLAEIVAENLHPETFSGCHMLLKTYLFHLKARNLSPRTIKATGEYLRPFLAVHDPLSASPRVLESYLADLAERCQPSTVQTAWRHLKGFYTWLHREGDINENPMTRVSKPVVPPVEIPIPTADDLRRLLAACSGKDHSSRRDFALITMMIDTGLRLTEVTNLVVSDVSEDFTIRVFGKGRKWRTVRLGHTASQALSRWLRVRDTSSEQLWTGRKGPLTMYGVRRIIRRRGDEIGIHLHPHMLRHAFVDNWLRNGGSEVDLARLCGWTTTRMAERYAQHRADERAIASHRTVGPLDRLKIPN